MPTAVQRDSCFVKGKADLWDAASRQEERVDELVREQSEPPHDAVHAQLGGPAMLCCVYIHAYI